MIIKTLFIAIFLLSSPFFYGQNLVPNFDFETMSSCPTGGSGLNNLTSWNNPNNSYLVDYFNSCDAGTFISVPVNFGGYQPASSGNGYLKISYLENAGPPTAPFNSLSPNRGYAEVQLTQPMQAGETYCVGYFWNFANNAQVATNNMDIAFSNATLGANGGVAYTNSPQISVSGVYTDTVNWNLFQQTYVATGGESFMTLGNFAAQAPSIASVGNSNGQIPEAIYYIEDVFVLHLDATISTVSSLCISSPDQTLSAATLGGVWSGVGVTDVNAGTFSPSTAGVGTHTITYTLACGTTTTTDTYDVVVSNCSTPTASFTTSNTTLCENDCINFTNASTGFGSGATYAWTFTGATTATSTDENPANICYPTVGTYPVSLTVTDGSLTDDTTTINSYITVASCSTPTASFTTSNTNLCQNDCINFTNASTGFGSGATYAWTFTGSTTATSTVENPLNVCYLTAGTYPVSLTVTDGSLTDDTTTVNAYITVTTCAAVTVEFSTSDDTICKEDCITFTNNSFGTGVANYGWNFDGGTPSTYIGVTPPQVCFNNPGNHTVTLVAFDASNNPLGSRDTVIVVENCVVITPTVNFTVSTGNLCENDCVSFTDQSFGIVGTPTYNWSFPGATTTTSSAQNPTNICYPAIGTYTVTLEVTDNNGTGDTTFIDIITVSECEHPVPSFTIDNSNVCAGQCVNYTNTSENSDSYEWIFEGGFPGGSLDENPSTICYDTEGEFNVTLIATNTLTSDTLIQTISVLEPPTVEASDSALIFQGTNTVISVETDGVSYVWSPAESLNCEDCASTNATPDSTTLYIVTVTAANGCAISDSVMVRVVPVVAIGLPSAFSPNGDQVNDILKVEGAGIEKINLTIYNRYGEKVFESNEKEIGWDGKFKGKKENPGIFVYTLEYVLSSGETGTLKGSITLVK